MNWLPVAMSATPDDPGRPDRLIRRALLRLLAALLIAAPVLAEAPGLAVLDPSARDSHELFLEELASAEDRTFRELLGRYDVHLADDPDDETVQFERCSFIEYASCGEDGYCPYWEEHERCIEAFAQRFPGSPAASLYRLERLWGEDALVLGKRLLEDASIGSTRWSESDLARVHQQIAVSLDSTGDSQGARQHARDAMRLDPSIDLTLLVARTLKAAGRGDEALEVVRSRVLVGDDYWQQILKIELLADLGAFHTAAESLESLNAPEGVEVDPLLFARVWTEVGRIDDARRTLADAEFSSLMDWQAGAIRLQRFQLELRYGDRESAATHYDLYRDTGFGADPFLRHRIRLAWSHPGVAWRLRDLAGVLSVLALVAVLVLWPVIVLLPVHYAGLLRRRSLPNEYPETRWRLRHAWYALALLSVADLPFLYMDGVTWLDDVSSLFAEYESPIDSASIPARSLAVGAITTTALMALGCALLVRGAARDLFSRGSWSMQRTSVVVLASLLATRGLLALWVEAMPESLLGTATLGRVAVPASLLVEDMCRAVASEWGRPALLAFLVLLVPLVEEALFRGVILDGLRRHVTFRAANLAQATLFASFHEAWMLFPFYLALGLLAGSFTRRSGGLLAAVLLHAGNNAFAFAALVGS